MVALDWEQFRSRITAESGRDLHDLARTAAERGGFQVFTALVCDGYGCSTAAWLVGSEEPWVRTLAVRAGWTTNGQTYDWCRSCSAYRRSLLRQS